ncbi:hypothetical protein ANCDUO_14266 [Ancylostoma duodenale]|uniref:Uncharacterized protein n=1 Tax=Ancylostoma duodenale TaxID=51022 RepID=A0A0C2GEN4_9BILA|nr:hypothetical protein ANCDUO_14266 [Ancylostoma duodenale]
MMDHKPVSPTQLLVKWSEFAAEFQTLENLEPAGNKLNFFQYHSLDVISFLIFIIVIILVLSVIITKHSLRRIVAVISKSKKQKTRKDTLFERGLALGTIVEFEEYFESKI